MLESNVKFVTSAGFMYSATFLFIIFIIIIYLFTNPFSLRIPEKMSEFSSFVALIIAEIFAHVSPNIFQKQTMFST